MKSGGFVLQLGALFLLASVLGWCVDTALRSARRRRFAPIRQIPFSPLYGLASLGLWAMPAPVSSMGWPLQFLTFAVSICAFEYVTGTLIFAVRGTRMWDYTDRHLHLDGHTDLFHFFLWGSLGLAAYHWALPALAAMVGLPGRPQ